MQTRKIGASQLSVSVIGLGCNNFGSRVDESGTRAVVDAALEAGITFFDTADIYGATKSEQFLGKALGVRRKDVIVASKFGFSGPGVEGGASPKYVRSALDASLRRLGTDWIDLYQLHRPDPDVPVEETLGALTELVQAGKVRHIGCSQFNGDQISIAAGQAQARGFVPFISSQNHYNLLHREIEKDVIPSLRNEGMSLIPFFPLESGLLTGKYRRGEPAPQGTRLSEPSPREQFVSDQSLELVERLRDFAESREITLLQVGIGWLLARPEVCSVIAGATKPEQVSANAAAATWIPTEDDLAELDGLTKVAVAAR